ncbi:MAG: sigma-70 family RNA polymerase sigma factor, partial [Sphingomonadales bacterium]
MPSIGRSAMIRRRIASSASRSARVTGDASALHRLVRKHQDRAYGYAFRLTRNPEEAGDIVAEAFVRVHNAVRNFKGNSAFTTWLYRIITNCYLDHRKKERTRQAL